MIRNPRKRSYQIVPYCDKRRWQDNPETLDTSSKATTLSQSCTKPPSQWFPNCGSGQLVKKMGLFKENLTDPQSMELYPQERTFLLGARSRNDLPVVSPGTRDNSESNLGWTGGEISVLLAWPAAQEEHQWPIGKQWMEDMHLERRETLQSDWQKLRYIPRHTIL